LLLVGLTGVAIVAALALQLAVGPPSVPRTADLASIVGPGDSLGTWRPSPAASTEPGPSASQFPLAEPSPTPIPTPPPPLAEGTVPILYLHRVDSIPAEWSTWTAAERRTFLAYDVLPNAFAAQLDWLRANGYTTILPGDLAAHLDHGVALPPRPVIITLDDGFPSWTRTILPMLRTRGMVAEFYLTLDAIERGTITWGEVRELAAAGMGIGAHDVHHVQLAMLGLGRRPASAAEMWYEVHQARLIIDREIGRPPDSMAYVGGGFNAELVALVRLAGYTTARSIERGISQDKTDRFALRVVAIGHCDDVRDVATEDMVPGLPVFAAKISGISTASGKCPTFRPSIPGDKHQR